jgi:hypothetical protein
MGVVQFDKSGTLYGECRLIKLDEFIMTATILVIVDRS